MIRILPRSLPVFLFIFVPVIQAQTDKILPWCGYYQHDPNRPQPPIVKVGPFGSSVPAPSDAIILFDGKDLSKWKDYSTGGAPKWKLENGEMVCSGDGLVTKESFGDVQVHAEWFLPTGYNGPWYYAGNNGVTMMAQFEIQTFDSYENKIKLYADGLCGAIYGQTAPLVNACRPTGEWQSFDIYFTAPDFENKKLVKPARITVLHNNVLIHLNQQIYGETKHGVFPAYNKTDSIGPILLPGHGDCKVRFRNVWVRKIVYEKLGKDTNKTVAYDTPFELTLNKRSQDQFSIRAVEDGLAFSVHSTGDWSARLIDLQGKQVLKTIKGNKSGVYTFKGLADKALLFDITTAQGRHIRKVFPGEF